MSEKIQDVLQFQFAASLQMLGNAIFACPDEVWGDEISYYEFWYYAYHTIFWTDFYLSNMPEEEFAPPAPFTLGEFEADVLPPRVYKKGELLEYLEFVTSKCRNYISSLSNESMMQHLKIGRRDYSLLEWLLYNMRHVQHHAAQLNLLLRQRTDAAPNWVSRG
jgi:hypothetical protein